MSFGHQNERPYQNLSASVGGEVGLVLNALKRFEREHVVSRIWKGDASLWKSDPESQKKIKERLGWLTLIEEMKRQVSALEEFGRLIQTKGFQEIVLLGMGGSSLFPEVCRNTFGTAPGYPRFSILDTTDPAAILDLEQKISLKKTLFILASKSGSTLELESLYRYFSNKIEALRLRFPQEHFMVITDPGSPLEKLAGEKGFRKVFLNPPDIGGRYSALSYFGLVPAALMGIDLGLFISRAEEMVKTCGIDVPAGENSGVQLGLLLAGPGGEGKNKVTFLMPEAIKSFGVWLEQLLAESTGKEGKGLLPVAGEKVGKPEAYGNDRLFIHFSLASHPDTPLDQAVEALRKSGQPVVQIALKDPYDLAGECFRWEMATAIVGMEWKINPFDEPNVTESKENTKRILELFKKEKRFPEPEYFFKENGITVMTGQEAPPGATLSGVLKTFLKGLKPSGYVALMAYLSASEAHETLLQKIRMAFRDQFRVAATVGYGPRFLHSTGQLHKGGAKEGVFFQITAEDREDLPVPGSGYSFGNLKQAQALGDVESLRRRGLPLLQLQLGRNSEEGLDYFYQSLKNIK
jgi:glucose-6-phosphate isomerase